MKPSLPICSLKFLRWFCREDMLEEIEGDLTEIYNREYNRSPVKAKWSFTWEVIKHCRPRFIKKVSFHPQRFATKSTTMLRAYLKLAARNFLKNKTVSFINVGGLALGMAVAVFISLWIYDEMSYNKSHPNYDHIGQVLQNQHTGSGVQTFEALPLPLAKLLRMNYHGVIKQAAATVRFDPFVQYQDKVLTSQGLFAESSFPAILPLDMLTGNSEALEDPNAILLGESFSRSLFGLEDPMNKVVKIAGKFSLQVKGVYKDFAQNSSFNQVKFIGPMAAVVANHFVSDDWQSSFAEIYVLSAKPDMQKIQAQVKDLLYANTKDASKPALIIHPMDKWHLYEFKDGQAVAGRLQFVWLFAIIDALVLLLACINFTNLHTARSAKRAKEVGIRKVLGSVRGQLVYQFFAECLLTVCIAAVLAITIVAGGFHWFEGIAGKQLSLPVSNPVFWGCSVIFILLTVLLAGSYPALYLSSFKPVQVLKTVFTPGSLAGSFRKMLVVVQFTVSVSLIIGTLQIYRQVQYAKNRPVGYDRNRLLTIAMNNPELLTHYEALKADLLGQHLVENLSRSSSTTTSISSSANNLNWPGKDPNTQAVFGTILVDPSYGGLVNWTLLAGRNFSSALRTDSFAFIFNETAIKLMGLRDPIGQTVQWHGKNWRIAGVVKDMVMTSPFDNNVPTVFLMNDKERNFNVIHVKLNAGTATATSLKNIETVFKKYCPSAPFEYSFADEQYAVKFAAEDRIGKLATLFAALAIFISCLGLSGLASYMAEQRTKEIGIRKVLGASVLNLWALLSKDFVIMVLISCAISVPLTWYLLQEWLQRYAYHTAVDWRVFAGTIAGSIVITLVTVSHQAITTAVINPVKSLRTE